MTFLLWLLLVLLATLVAYQFYQTTMLGGLWLTKSERFRPLYWNFTRLKWLARITGVFTVGCWIFFMAWLESIFREWNKYNLLIPRSKRLALILIGSSLFFYLLAQAFLLTS